MTEPGVLVHPHSGLHQLSATVFAALLRTPRGASSIHTARSSLPAAPPCDSRSRLRPRQLVPACTSRCTRLLREPRLPSQATSARLLLHTDTPWTDSAALPLWSVASVRFSPAGKKKWLYEMPWTPNQLSSVLTSFLTSFTSCLYPLPTYLPLPKCPFALPPSGQDFSYSIQIRKPWYTNSSTSSSAKMKLLDFTSE